MTTPQPADDLATPPANDAPNGERPKYLRGSPEYGAAWQQVREERRQAQREAARLSHQARRAARKLTTPQPPNDRPAPRQRWEPETPEQSAERLRLIAERRQRARERQRRRHRDSEAAS